jgi:opacity protein-like surface antigen
MIWSIRGRRWAAALAFAAFCGPATAAAQSASETAMDDRWHFLIAPYLWGSGMNGTVGVNGAVSVPVDLSFGDALENLDFAFLGRLEARKKRIGFGLDLAYLNLGAEVTGPIDGRLSLGADVRSLTVEGLLAYRAVNDDDRGGYVDLLAGTRYMKNRAGLSLERDGDAIRGTDQTLDWVDALVGARFRLPLGRKAALHGRADIAGLGSDFTWNVTGGFEMRLSRRFKTGLGYRYLDVDYDEGKGRERRLWQVSYQGPYAFLAYSW